MGSKNNTIIRGTTPYISCSVNEKLDNSRFYFSIGPEYGHSWVTVDSDDMSIEYEYDKTYMAFTLTQEQTLLLKAGTALAQMRVVDIDGNARASDTIQITVIDIVKDGEIQYE